MRSRHAAAGQPCGAARGRRRGPSRPSPSRRCRRRAACRPRRTSARRAAAAAASVSSPRSASARAGSAISPAFIRTERCTSASDGLEVALAPREKRVEEARRAGIVHGARAHDPREPSVLEEDVDELPEQVVGVSTSSWRTNGSSPGGSSSHSAPMAPNAIVRQPRSRASAQSIPRLASLGAERDHDVVGPREQPDLRDKRPSVAAKADRGQRPLADDHRVDELDRDVARVRACLRRAAEREQPPAARRSARPCGGTAARSAPASASKKCSLAAARRSRSLDELRQSSTERRSRDRAAHESSAREPVAPSLHALAGARADEQPLDAGMDRVEVREEARRGRSRGGAGGRSC